MKYISLLLFLLPLMAEECCQEEYFQEEYFQEHHSEFQTQICESEPDWSQIKDENDWPGRREDPFVEALKGN